MTEDVLVRFLSKIGIEENGCWTWRAAKFDQGYGALRIGGRKGYTAYAHRLAYEHWVGYVSVGLEIDHLCRNRACVNPDHLEAVRPLENWRRGVSQSAINARKTHCWRGHPLSGDNLMRVAKGRQCATCRKFYYGKSAQAQAQA